MKLVNVLAVLNVHKILLVFYESIPASLMLVQRTFPASVRFLEKWEVQKYNFGKCVAFIVDFEHVFAQSKRQKQSKRGEFRTYSNFYDGDFCGNC